MESAPALVRGSAKCIYPNVKPQYNAEISEIQIFFIKTSKKSKFLIDILLPSWYYVNAVSDSAADQAFRLCLARSWRVKIQSKLNMRMWRNWQTRQIQVLVNASSCGFKSRHPHHEPFANAKGSFFIYSPLFYKNRADHMICSEYLIFVMLHSITKQGTIHCSIVNDQAAQPEQVVRPAPFFWLNVIFTHPKFCLHRR